MSSKPKPRWAGTIVTEARNIIAPTLPAPCSRCGTIVDTDDEWHVDHIPGRDQLPPEQWLNREHLHPAHAKCNTRAGAKYVHAKRRRLAAVPPFSEHRPKPPPAAMQVLPDDADIDWSTPFTSAPRLPGKADGLPRNFTGPHPGAVASRGDEAVAWIEARMRAASKSTRQPQQLRWHQWLVLQRMLEVLADGSWAWPLSFWSVARQQGKTVGLGELACWLCGREPEGEPLELVHAANTVVIARQHQAKWVPWAKSLGYTYLKSLGDSQVIWPNGSVWRAVARDNMWGRTLDAALLDEVWRWSPDDFWSGVYPTLVERENSLAVAFSAANEDDRGLVETLQDDGSVCRMEWGALDTDDRLDPATWRKASAFWTPQRERAMGVACTKPGFDTEWLNIWPKRTRGRWIAPAITAAASRTRVPRVPPEDAACGIECSLDGQRWAVAAAWRVRGGLVARVWDAGTLEECNRIAGHRTTWAHSAVVERHDRAQRWAVRPVTGAQHRAATGMLHEAVMSGRLRLAGVADHTWEHVRVTPAEGGEMIDGKRSTGDVQAVKALAWAVWAVQSQSEPEFVL